MVCGLRECFGWRVSSSVRIEAMAWFPFVVAEESLVAVSRIEHGPAPLEASADNARVMPILDGANAHLVTFGQSTLGGSLGLGARIRSRVPLPGAALGR